MTRDERAVHLRSITTNPVFRDVLAELERDAFDQFMALPMWRRWGSKGRALIAHIEALRDVRNRLDWLANTQATAPRRVV